MFDCIFFLIYLHLFLRVKNFPIFCGISLESSNKFERDNYLYVHLYNMTKHDFSSITIILYFVILNPILIYSYIMEVWQTERRTDRQSTPKRCNQLTGKWHLTKKIYLHFTMLSMDKIIKIERNLFSWNKSLNRSVTHLVVQPFIYEM